MYNAHPHAGHGDLEEGEVAGQPVREEKQRQTLASKMMSLIGTFRSSNEDINSIEQQ